MLIMENEQLSSFLTRKFREWEASTKRRQTVAAFARWVGVSQPSMSRWMSGDGGVPTEAQNVSKLIERFGNDPEIYEILGRPTPNPVITKLQELDESDDPQVEEIFRLIGEWLSAHGFIKTKDTRDMR